MHETRELEYITSVSETIRKPPLAEAQTALGKQKNTFCGTRVSVPLSNFYESLLPTQNFTEIGQSAAEVWQKTMFKMAAVRHRESYKFSLVIWLSSSSKFVVVYRISSKSDDFLLR